MESTVYITKCELRNMNLVECRLSSQNDRTVSIASLLISLCTLASGLAKEAVVSLGFFLGSHARTRILLDRALHDRCLGRFPRVRGRHTNPQAQSGIAPSGPARGMKPLARRPLGWPKGTARMRFHGKLRISARRAIMALIA